MNKLRIVLTLMTTVALASPLAAQGRGRGNDSREIYGDSRYDNGHYDNGRYDKGKPNKKAKKNRRYTRIDGRLCEVKDGKDGRVTYRCEGDQRDRNPSWDRGARRNGDDDRNDDRTYDRNGNPTGGVLRRTQTARNGGILEIGRAHV